MAAENRYYKRAFLNKEGAHALGGILAEIDIYKNKGSVDIVPRFSISDCTRQINLDFALSVGKETSKKELNREIAENRFKLNVLLKTLTDFKDRYEECVEEISIWWKKNKKKKKKKVKS